MPTAVQNRQETVDLVGRGRYVVKVERGRSSGQWVAIAGVPSKDGTWWPAGVAISRKVRGEAISAAVAEADKFRRQLDARAAGGAA